MNTINVGDVYFMKDVIRSTEDPLVAKRLSYLLGAPSARPVVIIRGPMVWDKFDEVTILSATSNTTPAVTFYAKDRLGRTTDDSYSFCPHLPYSVPVGRLGRYIGSLDVRELNELLYAFKWIHDPTMQFDSTYPIPECYRDYFGKDYSTPPVKYDSFAGKEMFQVTLDNDGTIHTPNDSLKATLENSVLRVNRYYRSSEDTRAISTSNSDTSCTEPYISEDEDDECPTIHVSDIPPSMFELEKLQEIISGSKLEKSDLVIEDNVYKRPIQVLHDDEMDVIRKSLPDDQFLKLLSIYNDMTPFDINVLAVKLPTHAISKLCKIRLQDAATLKRMCSAIISLPEEEVETRLTSLKISNDILTKSLSNDDAISDIVESIDATEFRRRYPLYEEDSAEQRSAINDLRPYMTHNRIHKLTVNLQNKFIRLSEDKIQAIYSGRQFKYHYNLAFETYKKLAISRDLTKVEISDVLSPA